jgi:hypothetical protein
MAIHSASDRNFLPGEISRDGFLGTDGRSVAMIVRDDRATLERAALTAETVADFLDGILALGKRGLEAEVDAGDLVVRVEWARGLVPCPFGEKRLQPKCTAVLTEKGSGRTFTFSQLSVHLIRDHGFFGGVGSAFRVDPETVARWMQTREPSR